MTPSKIFRKEGDILLLPDDLLEDTSDKELEDETEDDKIARCDFVKWHLLMTSKDTFPLERDTWYQKPWM